ncbi:MAG: carboxymuconolactone decarboxylase family protein [Planctomycetes bacterium]|nr:carboxymuconolactone decarboxylase family protein [Planctomycetota bacterium]
MESERRRRGEEKIKEVYAGDIPVPPAGSSVFADLMLEQLFAEVWTREVLSMRDRRLLLLGAIAALGEPNTFGIQSRASLKLAELTPEQLGHVAQTVVEFVGRPASVMKTASD